MILSLKISDMIMVEEILMLMNGIGAQIPQEDPWKAH